MIDIQESKNQEKRNSLQRLYRTTTRIVRFKELWNNPKNVTNWLLPIFIAVDRGKITTRKEYQDILQGLWYIGKIAFLGDIK